MSAQGAGEGATTRLPRRVWREAPTRPPVPSRALVEVTAIHDALRALDVECFPAHERHTVSGLLDGIRSLALWYRRRVLECRAP